jgi:penicillin-binding protein 1A
MTLLNAFAESRNIPALKLAARVGIHKVIDTAHRFGVTSNIPPTCPSPSARRNHPRGAGRLLLRLPQRRHPRRAAPDPQGLQRRRHHPLGRRPRRQRSHHQQTARTMMTLCAPSPPTAPAAPPPAQTSLRRQDRHHQRLHRRLVPRLLALGNLRRLGRLRQPPVLGDKETGAKAALPIWMDFMIVGKDGERFLGDEKDDTTLKAAATPPTKPGAAASAVPGTPAKVLPAALKTSAPTGSPSKPFPPSAGTRPALPTSIKPASGSLPLHQQVKPALSPHSVTPKPSR